MSSMFVLHTFMLTGVEAVAEFPNLRQAADAGGAEGSLCSQNQYQVFVLALKFSHVFEDPTC